MVQNRYLKVIILIGFLLHSQVCYSTQLVKNPPTLSDISYAIWGDTYGWDSTYFYSGHSANAGWEFALSGALRFTNITIPQGATISSATIAIKQEAADQTAFDLTVKAFDEDNSAQITSESDFHARTVTTANVNWASGSATEGTTYTSGDIKTVIQEIIDRGSWASGNALQLKIIDTTYIHVSNTANKPPSSPTVNKIFYCETLAEITLTIDYLAYIDSGVRYRDDGVTIKLGFRQDETDHPLRLYKDGAIVGLPLVATGDPSASPVRVRIDGSTKAIVIAE